MLRQRLSEASRSRGTVAHLHSDLRRMILEGELKAGMPVSQVELAKTLGVSRIPLREAMRMLQEEGLLEAAQNRRTRVAALELDELDALYGTRILLESLAVFMTASSAEEAQVTRLTGTLDAMEIASAAGDPAAWVTRHRDFHALLTSGAPSILRTAIRGYGERCERYRRAFMRAQPSLYRSSVAEHQAISEACTGRDPGRAARLLARHLARTALFLIGQVHPEFDTRSVRSAVRLVTGLSDELVDEWRLEPLGALTPDIGFDRLRPARAGADPGGLT